MKESIWRITYKIDQYNTKYIYVGETRNYLKFTPEAILIETDTETIELSYEEAQSLAEAIMNLVSKRIKNDKNTPWRTSNKHCWI